MVRHSEKWGWLRLCSQVHFVFGTRSAETFQSYSDLETGTATSVCFPKG